jgi:transposase-like protein
MMNTKHKTKIRILKSVLDAQVTSASVARECEVDRSFISHVIAGRVKTPRIRETIARVGNLTVVEIWGVINSTRVP